MEHPLVDSVNVLLNSGSLLLLGRAVQLMSRLERHYREFTDPQC